MRRFFKRTLRTLGFRAGYFSGPLEQLGDVDPHKGQEETSALRGAAAGEGVLPGLWIVVDVRALELLYEIRMRHVPLERTAVHPVPRQGPVRYPFQAAAEQQPYQTPEEHSHVKDADQRLGAALLLEERPVGYGRSSGRLLPVEPVAWETHPSQHAAHRELRLCILPLVGEHGFGDCGARSLRDAAL